MFLTLGGRGRVVLQAFPDIQVWIEETVPQRKRMTVTRREKVSQKKIKQVSIFHLEAFISHSTLGYSTHCNLQFSMYFGVDLVYEIYTRF